MSRNRMMQKIDYTSKLLVLTVTIAVVIQDWPFLSLLLFVDSFTSQPRSIHSRGSFSANRCIRSQSCIIIDRRLITTWHPSLHNNNCKRISLSIDSIETIDNNNSSANNNNNNNDNNNEEEDTDTYFDILAGNIVNCLIKSDLKRKGGGDGGGSTGWTSWVDDASSYQLKCAIDALALSLPLVDNLVDYDDDDNNMLSSSTATTTAITTAITNQLESRDTVMGWMRWLKSSPSPFIIEMSTELRQAANQYIFDNDLVNIDSTREELLERMGMRIITLPSGSTLNQPIRTPPGAMAFGKLLWGGVKRFRILPGKSRRKTGEREAIKMKDSDNIESWLQYGGPERNYEAIDMGPCSVLEIFILPNGLKLIHALEENELDELMTITQLCWKPQTMFQRYDRNLNNNVNGDCQNHDNIDNNDDIITMSGKERNEFLESSFTETVGGLRQQVEAIIRRVLDGRVFRSFDQEGKGIETIGNQSLLDAKELDALGLRPVRGLLLYGPPGCGKTALAREISVSLRARKPKIVAAPELLDRWVGGSEKLVRSLFIEAEQELNDCGGDATKSSLHVIVIDEIDAVFRRRSASEDSAATTRASAVNQILAKLDGVNTLSNVLLIGMTNRRDLLDEALLRPGRLEVQVEIPLPTKEGRREILQIHFDALRRKGRLSIPLCRAIDGHLSNQTMFFTKRGSAITSISSLRSSIKKKLSLSSTIAGKAFMVDLASDRFTKGMSGADLQGLVRCSGSIALARARNQGMGLEGMLITLDDVIQALEEIKR